MFFWMKSNQNVNAFLFIQQSIKTLLFNWVTYSKHELKQLKCINENETRKRYVFVIVYVRNCWTDFNPMDLLQCYLAFSVYSTRNVGVIVVGVVTAFVVGIQ